jgi:hypothetical protein
VPDAHAGGRESPKPALARLEGYRPVATAHVGLGRLPNGSLITYYKVTLDDGEELRFYAPIAGAIAIVELSNEQIERALEILQCDLTEHRWKRRHGDKEPPLN